MLKCRVFGTEYNQICVFGTEYNQRKVIKDKTHLCLVTCGEGSEFFPIAAGSVTGPPCLCGAEKGGGIGYRV